MDRTALEGLDREALIARAEHQGISRARILTRPELIEELTKGVPSHVADDDGPDLLDKARNLLARVVERGLHLPDAAARIRSRSSAPPPPSRQAVAPLPTVTLAEIYATQGHREKASDTLKAVLQREPDHEVARNMLAQLDDATYAGASPAMAPERDTEIDDALSKAKTEVEDAAVPEEPAEPLGMLDDALLPPKYDVDECVAIPMDPTTLYVYWEVRDRTREHLERTRQGGVVALRALIIVPSWDGPVTTVRDQDVGASLGDWFFRDLPAGCIVRTALGWRVGDVFVPIAHSPALETPPGEPAPNLADALLRWTPRGALMVTPEDMAADGIERALGWARKQAERAKALGSSELFVDPKHHP